MKRCTTLGIFCATVLSISLAVAEEYHESGSKKRRVSYEGERCNARYESDCGYGYTCGSNGECEEMLDNVHPWVRRSVDQEHCAASQIIATVLALDSRRVAYGAVSSIRDDPSNQASVQFWVDCFKPGDLINNCDGGRNPVDVQSEIMKRLKADGLPSEYNLKFGAKVSAKPVCSGSGFRFQETVNYDLQMRDEDYKHFLNLRDKVISQGATVVHIKVFPEILLHSLDSKVINAKPKNQGEFVGYHSVVVDGVGTYPGGSGHYYLMQSSWSPSYGVQGRLKIDAETLYDHYLARKGILATPSFPVVGFAASDLNHLFYKLSRSMPDEKKGEFKKFFDEKKFHLQKYLKGRSGSLSLMSGYRDMNEGLDDVNEFEPKVMYSYDQKGDVPRLKVAMRVAMHHLKETNPSFWFRANYLVQADVSVAAGRKYHVVLQVDKWKYSDKDRIGSVDPEDRFFYITSLWIPMRGWNGKWDGVNKMTDSFADGEHEPAMWSYVYYKVLGSVEWSIYDNTAINGPSSPTASSRINPIGWIPFPKLVLPVLVAFLVVLVDDGRKQYRVGREDRSHTLERNPIWETIDEAYQKLSKLRVKVNQRVVRKDKTKKPKAVRKQAEGEPNPWEQPL